MAFLFLCLRLPGLHPHSCRPPVALERLQMDERKGTWAESVAVSSERSKRDEG